MVDKRSSFSLACVDLSCFNFCSHFYHDLHKLKVTKGAATLLKSAKDTNPPENGSRRVARDLTQRGGYNREEEEEEKDVS